VIFAHDQFLGPGDDVRVGQDPVAVDEEAGAGGGVDFVEDPGRGPVRLLVAVVDDLDDRLFRFGAFRQRRALRRRGQRSGRGYVVDEDGGFGRAGDGAAGWVPGTVGERGVTGSRLGTPGVTTAAIGPSASVEEEPAETLAAKPGETEPRDRTARMAERRK
jgi:hypothetical protein